MFLQSSGSRTRCALTALRIADEEKARLQTRIRQLDEDLVATGSRSDADVSKMRQQFDERLAAVEDLRVKSCVPSIPTTVTAVISCVG